MSAARRRTSAHPYAAQAAGGIVVVVMVGSGPGGDQGNGDGDDKDKQDKRHHSGAFVVSASACSSPAGPSIRPLSAA